MGLVSDDEEEREEMERMRKKYRKKGMRSARQVSGPLLWFTIARQQWNDPVITTIVFSSSFFDKP